MRDFLWRWKGERECRRARAVLARQVEEGGWGAMLGHLEGCPACREWYRRQVKLHGRLRHEQRPPRRLPTADAARIRAQVRHKIRRKSIMWHTRQAVQGVVALLIFVAAAAAVLWWQNNLPVAEPAATATPASEIEQVRLTLGVDDNSLSRYRPLIAAFEEEHPYISVHLASTRDAAEAEVTGVRAFASSFDVFPYSPNRQGDTQYLLNLRPFLDLDSHFDFDDFLPGLLPAAPEPLWAVPTGAAYYLTFFDQNAFDAAGISYPKLEWTTDDFLATAVSLTERDGDSVTRWGYVPAQLPYSALLATRLTGPLQTGDGLRLADPDVVAAVQWLADLFTEHQVSPWLDDYRPPGRKTGNGDSAMALINGGTAAMWHTTHVLYNENDEHVGVTAVPRGPQGYAAEPIQTAFAASRGTRHPEAAWQLLHFLSRQPPQEFWVLPAGPVPARRSVATATNYWQGVPPALAAALQYAAANNTANRINYQAAPLLQEAIADHIDGQVPVAVALGQLPAQVAASPEPEVEVVVPPAPPEEEDDDVIRITFTSSFDLEDTHRRLANQFRQENPGIRVTIKERKDYAATPLGAVTGSDCFVGGITYLEQPETRAALLPLDPILELDDTLGIDDFYPVLVELLVLDGQLWGIPVATSAPYMEYNRQIFEEAGIPPPSLDWTQADFLEIAQQLTVGEGESKQYGYAETWPYMYLGFAHAFGVQVVDNSVDPPHFDFAAAADMITWYVNLVRLYEVQPLIHGSRPVEYQEFQKLVREGRVAMWPGGGAAGITFGGRERLDFEVGVLSLPLGLSGFRGSVWTSAYHIMADSPHRQACWEWIRFLSARPEAVQPAASASRMTTARFLPAHISAAESEAYIHQVGEEMAAILHHFMRSAPATGDTLTRDWISGWLSPGFYWLRDAYLEAVTEEVSVTEALDNADAKFSQYRQCVIDRDAFDDYGGWRGCLLETDRASGWLFPDRSD
jgi:multiple sugar transport system substrate-binding protein